MAGKRWLMLVLLSVVLLTSGCSYYKYLLPKGPELIPPAPIASGPGHFVMQAYEHTDRKNIRVWTYRPASWTSDDQILMVMPGMSRNGEQYMNEWVRHAQERNLLILAPEFHNKYYRYTTNDYQDGNLFDIFGNRNPQQETAFQVIDNILSYVNEYNDFTVTSFSMLGHSAGAQFVHRMVLLHPDPRIDKAIAANAGAYTFVDTSGNYPYSLPDADMDLRQAFATSLLVLVGENDNTADQGVLDESDAAMQQGANRFERAGHFYQTAQNVSEQRKQPFNWQFMVVKDIGHDKRGMIAAAAKLF